jgi:nucleoside-triphosphatase THEP1
MFVLLTGPEGVGKTTTAWRAVPGLRARGVKVAGFVSPPLLNGDGVKTGINMVDLTTGERRIFARKVAAGEPVTIGGYLMAEGAAEWAHEIWTAALRAGADCLVVDEIGPLELYRGLGFSFALEPLADPRQIPNALVIVRESLVSRLSTRLGRSDIVVVRVTEERRMQASTEIVDLIRPERRG